MGNKEFKKLKNLIVPKIEEVVDFEKSIETEEELFETIKNNFNHLCYTEVITVEIIKEYKNLFTKHNIFTNKNINNGYVLITENKTFKIKIDGTAVAFNNSKIRAYKKTTIYAYDNVSVTAFDNSMIILRGKATATVHENAVVFAYADTKVIATHSCNIFAYDNSMIKAYNYVYVRAFNNSEIETYNNATVKYSNKFSCSVCPKCGCTDYEEWEELEYENGGDDPMYGGALVPVKFTLCGECD